MYTGSHDFNPRSPQGGATAHQHHLGTGYKNFNPRSPQGGATQAGDMRPRRKKHFNPRSPQGGATQARLHSWSGAWISIHAPRKGERHRVGYYGQRVGQFQSTLPARGSDQSARRLTHRRRRFQSTLPARGSDLRFVCRVVLALAISIHAPRKGERQRKSAFVCSISANLLNIIHCGTVTRTVSRRRIALFRLFSVRRSGVFMYAYASH